MTVPLHRPVESIQSRALKCAARLDLAIAAIECAVDLYPDETGDSFRAQAFGVICELRARANALRGML